MGLGKIFWGPAVALLYAGAVPCRAEAVRVEPVKVPPAGLQPLPMVTGGRMLTVPTESMEGFGPSLLESQWPASYFEAAFRGKEVLFRVGTNHEILHLIVDGQTPLPLDRPTPGVYRISGLTSGKHTVRVEVATESQSAPNRFGGFAIPAGEQALTPARHARQIEFIGDSHTVGYGNTSSKTTCTEDEVWATTDASDAFGPLVARHYGAEYQVIANSGHGVVRNYNGMAGDPVPADYPDVLLGGPQRYTAADWHPEVIVISLGTNDFSTSLHAGEPWKDREALHADYEKTYLRFVQELHRKDPGALILLWATEIAKGEIEAEVSKVVAEAKAAGDPRVEYLPVNGLGFTGCHGHPSLADDRVIAAKIEGAIDATSGVWRGL